MQLSDRWLLASELAGLRLRARWVTLSACQTARALVRPGEEWFGLARSFLVAGAGAVIASQWDVDDRATSRLMSAVYGRMAAGAGPAGALADVQSGCNRDGIHPLDWAGFVVLGGPAAAGPGKVPGTAEKTL
ncbi:MAG: CHAT domain-containing protein [Candidatus Eisenbacteria bacterium]|nr:CHAT domain-containing protein [Candidatus Eisenbacteria bacterium]